MLLFYYRFFSDNEYPVSENIVGEEVFNISDVRVWGGGGEGNRVFKQEGGEESKPTEQEECTSSASFCDITSF